MKVLIVEDETDLRQSIAEYLNSQNYRCDTAKTYQEALEKVHGLEYDCILLDLMLPGGDGLNVLNEIKKRGKQDGVIIISAKDSLDDKVMGLQNGADDYLAKPFHLSELAARIHSLLRRKNYDNSNVIVLNDLEIDVLAKTVKAHGERLVLTKTEFDLLLLFASNRNRVISKLAVAEHLTGDMADMMDNHDFVYAHIKNLKRKLTEAGCEQNLKTVYGTGYKWEE